jgi:hypothetical protein
MGSSQKPLNENADAIQRNSLTVYFPGAKFMAQISIVQLLKALTPANDCVEAIL